MVYHIDKTALTIISGPHSLESDYIRALTHCGNPELLDAATLASYGLVPQIYLALQPGQRYTSATTVSADAVTMGVETIPLSEIQAQRVAEIVAECDRRLLDRWPLAERLAALSGCPTTPGIADDVLAHIEARDAAIGAVNAAASVTAVQGVTPSWPV